MSYTYSQLQFTYDTTKEYIVYSGAISAADLVKDHIGQMSTDLSSEEDEPDKLDEESQLHMRSYNQDDMRTTYFSSKIVKNAIEDSLSQFKYPWPPTAENLNTDSARKLVPHCLYRLFNWIAWTAGINEELSANEYVKVAENEEKKILSIAQDIIFLKAKGRVVTPKHQVLSMTIRHMTRSSQLIQILNGFGHSASHSSTLEHDTALAQRQLTLGELAVPKGIRDGKFTTLVWDNIDFGEETLSGKGTTYSTNGIIIQWVDKTDTEMQEYAPTPSIKKTKQRSIEVPSMRLEPYFGTARNKDRPACIGQGLDMKEDPHSATQVKPRNLDLAFVMTRMPITNNTGAAIPSWTGFNTSLQSNIPALSTVGYLPAIDASPTKMETVKTILTRSMKYADVLHLAIVVLVFDQAIYAEAQKIIWEDDTDEWKKRLVRLGAFHTKMSYLVCIGIRYKDAGLADTIIESGLVASGSVKGVMNGHHYN